jgi:formamidopyrimidine-DNA glycosylase
MPELPEVETVVRGLRAAGLEGARIRDVAVLWHKTVAGAKPAALIAELRGRVIRRLSRRAKYIVMEMEDGKHLLVHLRMTGQFRIEPAGAMADEHDRVILTLSDGRQIHFHDTRKFGRFQLVNDVEKHLSALGPEPLSEDFKTGVLAARLAGKSRMLKPLLLDQTCVAGLGNIYVDEALWLARLHPMRRANTLKKAEIVRLHAAIKKVLAKAITAGGTSLGEGAANFYSVAGRRGLHAANLQVFRRTGEPCPRCGSTIQRMVVGQRSTHICPQCQPERVATARLTHKPNCQDII